MRKTKKPEVMKRQSDEAILKYIEDIGADGHSMLKPEALIKMGFEFAFVAKFVCREKSGKDFKSQLYDNLGKPVPYIDGVYSLSFIYGIANNIGADTTEAQNKMGRGFQAQCLVPAILKVVKPKPAEAKPAEAQATA